MYVEFKTLYATCFAVCVGASSTVDSSSPSNSFSNLDRVSPTDISLCCIPTPPAFSHLLIFSPKSSINAFGVPSVYWHMPLLL